MRFISINNFSSKYLYVSYDTVMFLACDYDGVGRKRALNSYKGFRISEKGIEDKIFSSNDPPKDFQDASNYISERIQATGCYCSMSSSVDHFVTDCRGVFEWYTDVNGNEIFDWAEKVKELRTKHQEEREKKAAAVRDFLVQLGVDEKTAWDDTVEIFRHCSAKTFLALSQQLGK